MRLRVLSAFALLPLLVGACAPGGPPAPPALAYEVPEPARVSYLVGDTARMDLRLGGQPFEARISSAATLAMSFGPAAEGVRVEARVTELDGRLSQPMGPAVRADESQVRGALAFTLDRRGAVAGLEAPELSGGAAQLLESTSLAHALFPRLPGRAARPGTSWTDTIRFESETGAGTVRSQGVLTYTLVGDTVVDGRSLAHITSSGTVRVSSSGPLAGMRVNQSARGPVEGSYLFDVGRSLLVQGEERSDLRGTLEVSMAPAPLQLRLRRDASVRLVEGG